MVTLWLSSIIKLNSLKSEWIRPFSKSFSNIETSWLKTFSGLPNSLTFYKGHPSTKDITIACLLQSIGTGVGNPYL